MGKPARRGAPRWNLPEYRLWRVRLILLRQKSFPGRREAASLEPTTTAPEIWIPGSRAAHVPRNDGVDGPDGIISAKKLVVLIRSIKGDRPWRRCSQKAAVPARLLPLAAIFIGVLCVELSYSHASIRANCFHPHPRRLHRRRISGSCDGMPFIG